MRAEPKLPTKSGKLVDVSLTTKKPPTNQPKTQSTSTLGFKPAAHKERRLKLLVWGDSGSGKTTLALQFPKPAVFDLEGGTIHYADSWDFDVMNTSDPDEIRNNLKSLMTETHPYKTLVIDPISILWETVQDKWSETFLRRNRGSRGFKHEFYDFQLKDWKTIKSDFYQIIRALTELDMNVIVTARQKTLFSADGTMNAVGSTYDAEKNLEYAFDTVVQLIRPDDGATICHVKKDRTGKLPPEFPCKIDTFLSAFGASIDREAVPITLATEEQVRHFGELIKQKNLDPSKLEQRLSQYGVDSFDQLSTETAAIIIHKLEI